MKCNLCLNEVPLIKKSHIIPNFMYKGLFDENHFISEIKLNELKIISRKPTGAYDRHILCPKCDNEVIGKYETYASKVLFDGNLPERSKLSIQYEKDDRGASRIVVENIDYNKFKLFLISLLWRGHISKHHFFSEINLGKYAEKARTMLLNGNAGKETEFESVMVMYNKDFAPAQSLIPTRKFRMQTNICYLIHIQSMSIIYKISEGSKMEYFELGKIKKRNRMDFYTLKGDIAKSFFETTTGVVI